MGSVARSSSSRAAPERIARLALLDTGIHPVREGEEANRQILVDLAFKDGMAAAAHDSPENKAFVQAFKAANNGMRPNFMAVGGYDGMHLIYEGLKKTNGAGGEHVDATLQPLRQLNQLQPDAFIDCLSLPPTRPRQDVKILTDATHPGHNHTGGFRRSARFRPG